MKTNNKRYYVAVVNFVYSLTSRQWKEFKVIRDAKEDRWDEALDYVERVGILEFELDGNYHHQ
jgi:hypothetical protein